MCRDDESKYLQKIIELRDLLIELPGGNYYVREVERAYTDRVNNFFKSPSYASVEKVINVINAAITKYERTDIHTLKKSEEDNIVTENIFIIHGRNEAKWRELKEIIKNNFKLNPIVLSEQPNIGKTIIEKFEEYARTCSCAIAIFTPDDEVFEENGEKYLQVRPNVIYEVGWFCGKLGRNKVILLLKEGTSIFSDFGGIVQNTFKENISEKISDIEKDLIQMNVLKNKKLL